MDVFSPKTIKIKSLDTPVDIHATGDWHVGEAGCDETAIKKSIDEIARTQNSIVILMGDLGGFIAPDDKRWDPRSVADGLMIRDLYDWGAVLSERIVSIAKPLRGKIVGSLIGNHEATYEKKKNSDVGRQIAKDLGCVSLGYSALFTLRFQDEDGDTADLRVMATHGSGGAITLGGKLNRLMRYMALVDADLVLVGHMHASLSVQSSRLIQSDSSIGEITQTGVITGTYLRTYTQTTSGYGERAGYHPTPINHPQISVIPRTKSISISWV